jgi:hypothetical protein
MHRNVTDFVPFALDAEVHHALAALHVAEPQEAKLLAADAVIEEGSEYRAVPYTLQRFKGRGLQQPPRWASPRAGVLPSLPFAIGHLTPSTGLPATALRSQR